MPSDRAADSLSEADSDDEDETYYVAGTFPHVDGSRRRHTTTACPYLQKARKYHEAWEGEAGDLPDCQWCQDDMGGNREQDLSYQRALKEAAADAQ